MFAASIFAGRQISLQFRTEALARDRRLFCVGRNDLAHWIVSKALPFFNSYGASPATTNVNQQVTLKAQMYGSDKGVPRTASPDGNSRRNLHRYGDRNLRKYHPHDDVDADRQLRRAGARGGGNILQPLTDVFPDPLHRSLAVLTLPLRQAYWSRDLWLVSLESHIYGSNLIPGAAGSVRAVREIIVRRQLSEFGITSVQLGARFQEREPVSDAQQSI
jgi:hypothetical protein